MSDEVVVAAGDSSAMVDVASPLELEVLAAASRKESPPPPSSTSPLVAAVAAAADVDMVVTVDSQNVQAIKRFQFPSLLSPTTQAAPAFTVLKQ